MMQAILLQREKWLIIGVLLILSAVAWTFTVYQAQIPAGMEMSAPSEQEHGSMASPGSPPAEHSVPLEVHTQAIEAVLFLAMWLAMMVAMMFPSVYPMVLLFARVSKGQAARPRSTQVPTWIFVAGYLAIWTLFGILVYPAFLAFRWLIASLPWLGEQGASIAGLFLIGAGMYQFTGWKSVCLVHCRSPLSFILHQWREGISGAFRMGIDHGAYCVGCCWGLMLVLFAMGLMNLTWMGLLTAVIFVEKVSQHGPSFSRVLGGVLIVLGALILFDPRFLAWFPG
jgi:predicted metal-binding membrane protein